MTYLLRWTGWRYWHPTDMERSAAGWPDLCAWHERHRLAVWIECKTDKAHLRPAQRDTMRSLARAGQKVATWRPRDYDLIAAWCKAPTTMDMPGLVVDNG